MDIPTFFDFLNMHLFNKWRQEIEQNNEKYFLDKTRKEKFAATLTDVQQCLLNSFELTLIDKMDIINYELCKQIFYFAIKTGMEIQRAFNE